MDWVLIVMPDVQSLVYTKRPEEQSLSLKRELWAWNAFQQSRPGGVLLKRMEPKEVPMPLPTLVARKNAVAAKKTTGPSKNIAAMLLFGHPPPPYSVYGSVLPDIEGPNHGAFVRLHYAIRMLRLREKNVTVP
jgi:hypothetical protein